MKEYRVTKYNPLFRNNLGNYTNDEWTDYSDIGRKDVSHSVLTLSEYISVEQKYIDIAYYVLCCKNISYFRLKCVEKHANLSDENNSVEMNDLYNSVKNNSFVETSKLPDICRLILRNHMWAKLYTLDVFIHFGYDYYMYVGFSGECRGLTKKVKELGLFIERFQSPYLK